MIQLSLTRHAVDIILKALKEMEPNNSISAEELGALIEGIQWMIDTEVDAVAQLGT